MAIPIDTLGRGRVLQSMVREWIRVSALPVVSFLEKNKFGPSGCLKLGKPTWGKSDVLVPAGGFSLVLARFLLPIV